MGRTVDQEVHAAFVEFRAKEDDKVRDLRISRNISASYRTGTPNHPFLFLFLFYVTLTDCYFRSAFVLDSAFPSSVSTASRFAQRTPRVRSSIFSSAPVFAAIPTLLSLPHSLPRPAPMASLPQMATLPPPTVLAQGLELAPVVLVPSPLPMARPSCRMV